MLKKSLYVLNWVKIRAVKLKRRLATIWLGILVTVPPKNSVKIINFLRHISLKIFHYRPKVPTNIAPCANPEKALYGCLALSAFLTTLAP